MGSGSPGVVYARVLVYVHTASKRTVVGLVTDPTSAHMVNGKLIAESATIPHIACMTRGRPRVDNVMGLHSVCTAISRLSAGPVAVRHCVCMTSPMTGVWSVNVAPYVSMPIDGVTVEIAAVPRIVGMASSSPIARFATTACARWTDAYCMAIGLQEQSL